MNVAGSDWTPKKKKEARKITSKIHPLFHIEQIETIVLSASSTVNLVVQTHQQSISALLMLQG